MELNEFESNNPEEYAMLDEYVNTIITDFKITGEESLVYWDNMVDNIVKKYEQMNEDYSNSMVSAQQIGEFRDRGRDRHRDDRHRRRFPDFNVRDILRLLFLRKLFDRNRR